MTDARESAEPRSPKCVPWPLTKVPFMGILLVFLILLALIAGWLMGMAAGYSSGFYDGISVGMRQYQETYCREYPFTLVDPKQYSACRKVGE